MFYVEKPKLNRNLADKILNRLTEENWDQENWLSLCGTQACVGGWAIQLSGEKVEDYLGGGDVSGRAQELLGLTYDQANELFYDPWDCDEVTYATLPFEDKLLKLKKLFAEYEDENSG
jgi:hypothetical protein